MMHPDNYGPVTIILQMRIYDALIAILGERDSELAQRLIQTHANGDFVSPPPRMVEYEEDNQEGAM